MNKKRNIIILSCMLTVVLLLIIFLVGKLPPPTELDKLEGNYPILKEKNKAGELKCYEIWEDGVLKEESCRQFDYAYTTVARGNSMYPTIKSGDILRYKFVEENELLWTGEIYSFKYNETDYITHRLVSYLDNGDLVFKGDNNVRVEIVKREQVERRLVGITWN